MKRLILLLFFLFFAKINFSQIFIDTNDKYKAEYGFHSAFLYASNTDRITFDKTKVYFIRKEPFLGIYPFGNNFSTGIKGEVQFVYTNIGSYAKLPILYGIGIYSRYIFKKSFKYKFFKNIRFFTEINFNIKNYRMEYSMPVREIGSFTFNYPDAAAGLKYYNFNFPVAGITAKIYKNFNFELAGQYSVYFGGKNFFDPRFSFSYILKEKTQEEIIAEQNKKLQKKYKTKEKEPNRNFLNGFVAGTSLTYIYDNSHPNDYPENKHFYREYTWNLNFAANLSRRFTAGVQVLNIFTEKTFGEKNNYLIYGLFSQFDFLPHKKTSLFAEFSVDRGNYCTCGISDPYEKNNLWYYGLGAGIEFPLKRISEKLFLDLSFVNYNIINNIEQKYNYTQYIVGLNYHIGKERK